MENPLTKCVLAAHQEPKVPDWRIEDHLRELGELARACEMEPVDSFKIRRAAIDSKTFYGKGKLKQIQDAALGVGSNILLCDDELTGSQARAIEDVTGLRPVDRTGLILSIFERRAKSSEARTQVELARLEYELPRLKGRWTHLERQEGSTGIRGGPGETQIEVDRRMVRNRISQLRRELAHLQKVRDTQAQGRKPGLPRVSLVGYTNSGKTTILRALTGEGEPQNQLFATLDTMTRKAWLGADPESGQPIEVLVSDTVGFIRKLPHQLVAAFRSTLGEVKAADALMIVTDAAHPEVLDHLKVVNDTLKELGCQDQPRLLILNQADRLPRPKRLELQRRFPNGIFTRALEKADPGLQQVREWLRELIPGSPEPREPEAWELEL